ncbi:MAG TPA: cell division/cell wall cluster transcriptional repressor MraZ [Sphaerochaeta sp.]|jgi:MraZ protein|nr:cell division/cell wall cluster transcriptional repressor MraZ [Sphaerochaeta sp.]
MRGEFRNTIDEKGRLMIPPRLREQLGTSVELVLTKSLDNALWLFTAEDFDNFDNQVNGDSMSLLDSNATLINRLIISPARDVELDKTGRLSIPQVLRDFAGLEPKSECVILGSRTHVEIMSAKAYDDMLIREQGNLKAAGNALTQRGR